MRLEYFVLFLDENLCNCRQILETLQNLEIRFERHLDHFERGAKDEVWLPEVGNRSWILLTADQRIRYNPLERRAVIRHRIREFVFASTMSGADYATALIAAIPEMRKLCEKQAPPFIATITKKGVVHVRYDEHGALHGRDEPSR